jgi:phage-related baseplate assembly protein
VTILPEVNFVETDPEIVKNSVIEAYESLTGRKLYPADPVRLFLLSIADVIIQQRLLINHVGKQNLLYYSEKNVLDHKGYAWGTPRLEAEKALTTIRFYFSTEAPTTTIPQGTRVGPDGNLAFETLNEVIAENVEYIDVEAECTVTGAIGNGYSPGTIVNLVKPIPFVQRVENITLSEGGSDREDDESYRERIHQAPEKLSVAGPELAYRYWANSASSLIVDVDVASPNPGEVKISILLENGQLPEQEFIDEVYETINDRKVRPLTDKVTVTAPEVINYNLSVIYYIPANDVQQSLIRGNIEKAINDYVIWQKSKIGRDINPSKLVSDCVKAGAKRVDIVSPQFVKLEKGQIAVAANVAIEFGGVEDD